MKAEWRTEKLGEVCSFLNRGSSPKYLDEGGICVLGQRCVRNHRVYYEYSRRHDDQTKAVAAGRFVVAGDVLVNSTGVGSLGRVAQVRDAPPEPTTVDSHVTIVRPRPGKFFPDFFGYMMMTIEDAITEAGEGCGGQTELGRRILAERFSVSYPTSLEEQRRIVGILDEAFEGIAAVRENAEMNLRSARALFESHLESVFDGRGEGWTDGRLGQAVDATCTLSYGIVQPGEECPNGLPVVRPMDLTTKTIPAGGLKRIDPKRADSYQRTRLHGGELLLCVRGSTGVVSVASAALAGANVTRGIVPVRFDSAVVSQEFGYYLLRSSVVQRQVREKTYGAALMQVNIRDVRDIRGWYPSLKEQAALVARLDELTAITERLEANSQRKLAGLEELKQSLLHQAFSGQL